MDGDKDKNLSIKQCQYNAMIVNKEYKKSINH